jgi:hypothetical protein
MDKLNNAENAEKFICIKCDFKCYKQSNYATHLLTAKHNKICNDIIKMPKDEFICSCGKEYKHSSGLWRHKQNCKPNDPLLEKVEQNIQSIMALSNFY